MKFPFKVQMGILRVKFPPRPRGSSLSKQANPSLVISAENNVGANHRHLSYRLHLFIPSDSRSVIMCSVCSPGHMGRSGGTLCLKSGEHFDVDSKWINRSQIRSRIIPFEYRCLLPIVLPSIQALIIISSQLEGRTGSCPQASSSV